MSDWSADFVPEDGQLFGRTMGEALAKMVRIRWPQNTAKQVARAWDLDPTTATNVTKGHSSERTITKAIKAEGWPLLEALGKAMTGQSYHEWEEARLQRIIEEAKGAEAKIELLRARSRALRAIDPPDERDRRAG